MLFKYAVTQIEEHGHCMMSLEFKLKDKCKEGRLDIQSVGGNTLF